MFEFFLNYLKDLSYSLKHLTHTRCSSMFFKNILRWETAKVLILKQIRSCCTELYLQHHGVWRVLEEWIIALFGEKQV